MNGRPSLGTQGQYSALYYRMWTLLLLHYCDDYNAVKHIWKYKLQTLFECQTKRIQCQWGSFRLCQIRNFLVSRFRTKVSCGLYGLNCLRSKEQMCDLCCTAHRFSLNHTTKLQICNSVITLYSYYTIWNYTNLTFPETVNLSDNPYTHFGFHFYIHVKQIQLFKRSTSFMNLNLKLGSAPVERLSC